VFTTTPTFGVWSVEGGARAIVCPCSADAKGILHESSALFAFAEICFLLEGLPEFLVELQVTTWRRRSLSMVSAVHAGTASLYRMPADFWLTTRPEPLT
jgi:hypothetical protein